MEKTIQAVIGVVILVVESLGAAAVAVGAVAAVVLLVRGWLGGDRHGITRARVALGRALALALEFQLAADVLATAVAPTWDMIGRLAAIAAIRTALNHFLAKEIAEQQEVMARDEDVLPARPARRRAARVD